MKRSQIVYGILCSVLILIPSTVGVVCWYIFDPIYEFVDKALSTEWEAAWHGLSLWFKIPIVFSASFAISWKVLKMLVQGCPFNLGMVIIEDMKSNLMDRLISMSYIGKRNEYAIKQNGEEFGLWFGAIFSSHPKTDSLHKRRLILLIFALPNQWSLILSRGVLLRKHGHQGRTNYFDTRINPHIRNKK